MGNSEKYYKRLPRKVRKVKVYRRCQHLNSDGTKCDSTATIENDVHLDNEVYHYERCWVTVFLCEKHTV
jgi:hypothetical protein